MKNLFIPIAGFLAIGNVYGQCTITASKNLAPNEAITLSVDTKAQCEECYIWKASNDQLVKIEGNNKLSKISLTEKSLGNSTVSVSILTAQGLVQCEKNIDIINAKKNLTENRCGISIDDFKDVKVNESIVSFFPNSNSGDYIYKWIVAYSNGETEESLEKIPQFNYSETNYITSVKLKISNKTILCSVMLTKKYDHGYWKTSKSIVEQKVYSPVSYNDYVKQESQSVGN